jgi:hypothetical protein
MNIYEILTEDGIQYIEYDILIRNVLKHIYIYIFCEREFWKNNNS